MSILWADTIAQSCISTVVLLLVAVHQPLTTGTSTEKTPRATLDAHRLPLLHSKQSWAWSLHMCGVGLGA